MHLYSMNAKMRLSCLVGDNYKFTATRYKGQGHKITIIHCFASYFKRLNVATCLNVEYLFMHYP